MSDPRDYKLDLSSTAASRANDPATPASQDPRPFISVHFACCNVYLRIYRSPDGRDYHGRCPRCGLPVHVAVGEGGTSARTFVVRHR